MCVCGVCHGSDVLLPPSGCPHFLTTPTWIFPPATLEITDQYDADLPMNDLHLDREYQWKILAMTSTTIVF